LSLLVVAAFSMVMTAAAVRVFSHSALK
jgi:hypothetical protein